MCFLIDCFLITNNSCFLNNFPGQLQLLLQGPPVHDQRSPELCPSANCPATPAIREPEGVCQLGQSLWIIGTLHISASTRGIRGQQWEWGLLWQCWRGERGWGGCRCICRRRRREWVRFFFRKFLNVLGVFFQDYFDNLHFLIKILFKLHQQDGKSYFLRFGHFFRISQLSSNL